MTEFNISMQFECDFLILMKCNFGATYVAWKIYKFYDI